MPCVVKPFFSFESTSSGGQKICWAIDLLVPLSEFSSCVLIKFADSCFEKSESTKRSTRNDSRKFIETEQCKLFSFCLFVSFLYLMRSRYAQKKKQTALEHGVGESNRAS